LLFCLFWVAPVLATGPLQPSVEDSEVTQEVAFQAKAGFSEIYAEEIISNVIQVFLSLLSMIFIILILYAGYNWMTAGGDEQKVTKAKDTIYRAVIGLVITISAFVLTYFVFNALPFGGGPIVTP
jgi:hypothetical protein